MSSSSVSGKSSSSGKSAAAKKASAVRKPAASGKNTKVTKRGPSKGSRAKQDEAKLSVWEDPIAKEIILILVGCAAIFLFLCNFGLIGPVGKAISSVLFGVFGVFNYILPLLVAGLIFFEASNAGNLHATLKIVACVVLFFMLGIFAEVIGGAMNQMSEFQFVFLYKYSAAKHGGGVISGSLAYFLCHYLSRVGCIFLTIAISIICVILISEKSLIYLIKSGGIKAYEKTKSGVDRSKQHSYERRQNAYERRKQQIEEEELREQERILRMDKKADGVTIHTLREKEEAEMVAKIRDDIHEIMFREEEMEAPVQPKKKRSKRAMDYEEELNDYQGEQTESYQEPSNEQIEYQPEMQEYETGSNAFDDAVLEKQWQDGQWDFNTQYADGQETYDDEYEDEYAYQGEIRFHEEEPDEEPPSLVAKFNMPTYSDHAYAHADSPYETQFEEKQSDHFAEEDPTALLRKVQSYDRDNRPKASLNKEESAKSLEDTSREIAKQQMQQPPKKYIFPPLSLLRRPDSKRGGDSQDKLRETAQRLQQTLQNFGVNVTITNISQGPTVTRYELQPEQGVKVSKIVGLTDDIKLNLAATDIRMEAPIPGKAAIGIEVPNQEAVSVGFYDLVSTRDFKDFSSNLAFAVGKDIGGKVIIADIAKMPHLLIAGATGSGKSVCINTIIMSILYKATPDDVKMIMIDPKVVELSVYNGIPHLLIPVVTEAKKAAGALQWGVAEMTDRYQKFAEMNVRDVKGYNAKLEEMRKNGVEDVPAKMPQIVIIVDELADLMMVAQNEVEEAICRLAQLARAAGIHLIIATQRPSVDVITGLIKANMPSRVAFAVSSGVDSRTILDQVGAEKLLGKGDMLFYPQGYTKPARLQGAFISDDEVSDVVDFLKNQVIGNVYNEEIQEKIQTMKSAGGGMNSTDTESGYDELFEQAARRIFERNKASIGDLQRGLKVGFNRAARIMDQLCEAGVVGDDEGTKPRKILMSEEQFEEFVETYL